MVQHTCNVYVLIWIAVSFVWSAVKNIILAKNLLENLHRYFGIIDDRRSMRIGNAKIITLKMLRLMHNRTYPHMQWKINWQQSEA